MSFVEHDPGWQVSWRSVLSAMGPQRAVRRSAEDPEADQLVMLRQVFVSFSMMIVLVTVVVLILGDLTDGDETVGLSIGIVVAIGVVSLIAGRLLRTRLDCTSGATLAVSYRSRFFLRLAFADAAALAAFVVGIALGPWWVYFIGLGFTIVGFIGLMPSRRNLAADQAELAANGCHRSLVEALRATSLSDTGEPPR